MSTFHIIEITTAIDKIAVIEELTGASMFMGRPARWYKPGRWRCLNDHVSTKSLNQESGGSRCRTCDSPLFLTFPEDTDGPLVAPSVPTD